MSRTSRWIIVSNRLPFKYKDPGKFSPSSGGLVTAIGGIRSKNRAEKIWVGGAPEGLTEEIWQRARPQATAQTPGSSSSSQWRHVPVFIEPGLYDSYYNGFCNHVLWPLLHYENDLVQFSDSSWKSYVEVNERFAQEIAAITEADDLVWIHDYHFLLLPAFLKRLRPDLRVGFFLHVPFPSSEVFRQLPMREEILESLLSADLVGFHDYSYLHHFCSSLSRLLGVDCSFLNVKHKGHLTRLGVFPVSIDTPAFQTLARSEEVSVLEERFRRPNFVFLGVDRLDYIKGIDLKLAAFKNLLERYPEVRGEVSLLQVAVPTREGSVEFERLHQETNRMVGELNGEYSRPDWTPVHYMHSSVNSAELMALYRTSDALLVTSKRDGMNLVALEYIAAKPIENPGVVLLSEFTGALSTLAYTLAINPWNVSETADKMKIAMEMPSEEKAFRLGQMAKFLEGYTATDWAQSFLQDLASTSLNEPGTARRISLTSEHIDRLARAVLDRSPQPRVILFLDYDGTLVPIHSLPEQASLPDATREKLRELKQRFPFIELVVISGRESKFLQSQLDEIGCAMAAEHGATFFDPLTRKWQKRVLQPRSTWYPAAMRIFSDYTARVPASHIERKAYTLAWHYRRSPREHGSFMARKLAKELEMGLANLPVAIVRGDKVIEVRSTEADKGILANWYFENRGAQSIALAIGDDRTDEDMFLALKGRGISIHVGNTETSADYVLDSQSQVLPLIEALGERIAQLRSEMNTDLQLRPSGPQGSVVNYGTPSERVLMVGPTSDEPAAHELLANRTSASVDTTFAASVADLLGTQR